MELDMDVELRPVERGHSTQLGPAAFQSAEELDKGVDVLWRGFIEAIYCTHVHT
jgi:hypothetical protein